jgi:hypothetical protein
MSAVLLMAPWVRVELVVQIYLSLYFPFKIFMMILHFLKINIQQKEERKKFKVDFPDNIHIMVLLVCPLVFITALLHKEIWINKTEGKPTPKPTLTIK